MSRRVTAVDRVNEPKLWESLTEEQREEQQALAKELRDFAEKDVAKVARIKDPSKRMDEHDRRAQALLEAYKAHIEARDDEFAAYVSELPSRQESRAFTVEKASRWVLSESRLRQVRVKERIGTGARGDELARKLTREFLEREYHRNERTLKSIANEVGCDPQTVGNYLKRYRDEDVESGISEEDSPFRSRTLDDWRESQREAADA